MQQAAAAAQARKGGRMSPAEGWETVPSARRESGRSRQGAGARADGQGRRHAGAGSGRSNSGGGATGAGSAGSGRAGSGARRGAGSARGLDPRAGEPDSEAHMFDPETRQRLHNMLDEYIEKKCTSNEQCQKSDFDASAREALQRISFLQALQAIEHFASSVSSRIVNRPAYLMGILRGQEMHWDKSRAAASLPGGSADLLGMPGELMLLVGEFCLVGHCMPSDFTPEVCLALQRLTPPLAVKAVQAFNANKRICAGNRGGVLNRPRFFQRLIQNVADQNSEASEDTPGASSASVGLAGDTEALGAPASALPPGHPDGQDDKPYSQTQQHTSSPPPLGAPASSLEDEEEDSGGLGQHATTKQETLQPPTHTRNAWGTPETGTTSASTSNPSAGGNSNKLNVSTPSARSADGSASSVSTGTGSGEADDADADADADPDADPAHEAYEEHSAATAADTADGFASTGRPSLTASSQVGSLVVPSSGVLDSADGGEDSAAVAAAVAAAAAGGPGASSAAQTGSGSAATQAWDDSAFGAAGNAIYWNPGGLGPVAGEPTTPKSARGRTSSFMTPSPQVHFKDRPQTADRSARPENTAGPSAAFDDPRSRPAGLVGSDFLDSAFDTRSRTSSVAYESQSADATAPPWDAVRDRNTSLFFNTAGPSATSGPVAGSSATGPTGLPRAPGHGPDAGVFFSDPSAFSDQFASTASSGAWTNTTGPSGPVDVASSASAWTQQQRDGSPSSSSTTTAREPSSSTSSSNSAPPSESSSDLHARVRHLEGLCARLEQENSHLRQRQDVLTAGLRQLLAAATAPAAPR